MQKSPLVLSLAALILVGCSATSEPEQTLPTEGATAPSTTTSRPTEPPLASSLDGTSWILATTSIDGTVTVIEEGVNVQRVPTIGFDDGEVSGNAGCNRFEGFLAADSTSSSELRFEGMWMTFMGCGRSGEMNYGDPLFREAFQSSDLSVELTADAMIWRYDDGDGEVVMKFSPA